MGELKTRDWKLQNWKTWHRIAGLENAGLEKARPNNRAGKHKTGKCGTKLQDWKMRERISYGKLFTLRFATFFECHCSI